LHPVFHAGMGSVQYVQNWAWLEPTMPYMRPMLVAVMQ
jgi:hypothetical protein